MNQFNDNSGIEQQLKDAQVHGGILANQGDKNVQVHGEGNVLTFNQTEILQISEREITTRELVLTSPYKGLKMFESRDKELFFGRDNFITSLVNELEQTNLVLLLGASGSGKSSVVRAGLIPWLERKYGTRFTNLTFTPDIDPFESFYGSLLSNYSQKQAKIAREINSETLVKVAKLKHPNEFWFIFIDQFEELFTTSDENKRRKFIDGLMKLSKAKLPNIKIMATMRGDFLERLSEFPQLVEATQKHRPMIVEMQPNELRLAIEQPAAHHGMILEAGLVDKIIAEVKGQAGYLPLLQYTLNLLWEDEVESGSINDRVLNISTYENIGGVKGALQQHVNLIYKQFSPQERLATQRIFLKLVGIGENAAEGIEWKPVRRRAMLSEFRDDEQDVLLRLINENLLVSNVDLSANSSQKVRKSKESNSTVEIAHEILLTCWDKLDNWIKKNRQGIAIRNRLYEDVKRWQAKKPEDELWTGSKLEQVLELKQDDNFNQVLGGFNQSANQFIDASVGLRDRQLKRTRIFAGIGFSLAALAGLFGVFAFSQQQEAQKQSIINMAKTAEAHLLANNELDAMKEAITAKKHFNNLWFKDPNTRIQLELGLLNTVHNLAVPNTLGGEANFFTGSDVSFSRDGKMLASASRDNTVRLWNSSTGKLIKTLVGHTDDVIGVSFSHDGKMLASSSRDKTVKLWDTSTGKLIKTLVGHSNSVYGVSFSHDGKMLASGSSDDTVKLWDTSTGKLIKTFRGNDDIIYGVSFSPDGLMLASAGRNNQVKLWNTSTGKEIATLGRHKDDVYNVSFSPDGSMLASVSRDNTVKLWDTSTGKEIAFGRHKDKVYNVRFSPDSSMLASVSRDNTVKLWNTSTKEIIKTLSGNKNDTVRNVSFSPDSKTLTSASFRNTFKEWDISTGRVIRNQRVGGHSNDVYSVSFSPDSKMLASASADYEIKLWDTSTNEVIKTLNGHSSDVRNVSFSPDGKMLASASFDNKVKLWNVSTGEEIKTEYRMKHARYVYSVSFSPDGKTLASASTDNTIKLWNVRNGRLIKTLDGHKQWVYSVSFSPDGKMLASASRDNTVKLWNTSTYEEITTLSGHTISVLDVSFSHDGKMLASASRDNTIKLWNTSTYEVIKTLKGHKLPVENVSFSHDSKMLASASRDDTVKLWDTSTGKLIKTLIGRKDKNVNGVSFSPDGKMLASASDDNTVRLWKLDFDYLLKEGCNFMREYYKTAPVEDQSEERICQGMG